MTKGRVHICTGGELDLFPDLAEGDKLIGVDAGAIRLVEAGFRPDIAVGDFDTIGESGIVRLKQAGIPIKQYPAKKDATDTEVAIETALSLQPDKIILYGAIGSRMDHTLANLQLLWPVHQCGVWIEIASRHNRVMLLSEHFRSCQVERGAYSYVSLIPLTLTVIGVTLDGFLYPLTEATLELGSSLGISNQLSGERGTIRTQAGILFVIQSKDDETIQ